MEWWCFFFSGRDKKASNPIRFFFIFWMMGLILQFLNMIFLLIAYDWHSTVICYSPPGCTIIFGGFILRNLCAVRKHFFFHNVKLYFQGRQFFYFPSYKKKSSSINIFLSYNCALDLIFERFFSQILTSNVI